MKKIILVLVALMLVFPATAYAYTRTEGGGDLPYYARIERGEILHTDQWAAVIFYRPTMCVPLEFNLLDFYDFNAFGCTPPTTDGFILWSGEPWLSDPVTIKLHGLGAVPVWFVRWSDLETAIADDTLTMVELQAIDSLLVGQARIYTETLHPASADPEVKKPPLITYVAKGSLEDGRSFSVHVLLVVDRISNVEISFK